MLRQRQLGQRMIVAHQADRVCVPDLIYDIDSVPGILDAKTLAREDMPVTLRVQFRKSLAELEFLSINADGAIRPFLTLYGILREIVCVNA